MIYPPYDEASAVNKSQLQIYNYIAGYVAKAALKSVNNCTVCKKNIIADEGVQNEGNELIGELENVDNILLRPSVEFSELFVKLTQVTNFYLPIILNKKVTLVRKTLMVILKENIIKI